MKEYQIKEVEKITGISINTLRYYDRNGILSPQRKENDYRSYSEHDILKLEYLAVMKYAKFSLEEIKDMLELIDGEPSEECKEKSIVALINKKIELQNGIDNFKNIIKLLEQTISVSKQIDNYEEEHVEIDKIIHEIFNNIKGE